MSNKTQSGRITPANILAVAGVCLLLAFSFMGQYYMRGGELGWSIVISVGITAFTALLLYFLIKVKGAENDLSKWRKVEYALLAAYIVIAIPASCLGGIMHFFVVNSNKETIKEYAKEDLAKIDKLFNDYEEFEKEALSQTGTGLYNATGYNQRCNSELREFMEANGIERNRESAKAFEELQRNIILGVDYDLFRENYSEQKGEIEKTVKSWSIILIPSKAKQIEDLANNVKSNLDNLSSKAQLPKITHDAAMNAYVLGENQSEIFEIEGGTESLKFRKALQEQGGFSVVAILVIILIHILILMNYFVAYRTWTVEVGASYEEDGGRIL